MSCACCSHDANTEIDEPFLQPSSLRHGCPLDNGAKHFKHAMIGPQNGDCNKCYLQCLPIELYQACLQYLDVGTLTTLRRVSQYTRHAIDSLYQYEEIFNHTPQVLRACLSTGIAPHIPLFRLHDALTNMACHYCLQSDSPQFSFGTYLSLYECYRTCVFCLRNNSLLKPVELQDLIKLCFQRNCSIGKLDSFKLLSTVTGPYGPPEVSKTFSPRITLLRGPSVTAIGGKALTEKEQRTLIGSTRTATIYHHPFVNPSDESDISPTANYVASNSSSKQIRLWYMLAVPFPYLTSGKKVVEHGVMCGECNLYMRYREHRWAERQRHRRQNFQDPVASFRTRDFINSVRKLACRTYTTSEEGMEDARQLGTHKAEVNGASGSNEDSRDSKHAIKVRGLEGALSIQDHQLFHAAHASQNYSAEETAWRAKVKKGPPLPQIRHQRFA